MWFTDGLGLLDFSVVYESSSSQLKIHVMKAKVRKNSLAVQPSSAHRLPY